MRDDPDYLEAPILSVARQDFAVLDQDMTVEQALSAIRQGGIGEKIIYFYIVDEAKRMVGVLPTRRLLTVPLDKRLVDIMIRNVIAIPQTATILEACDYFTKHKFFAFPVVDDDSHILGLVDVGLFTDELFDIAEREQMDNVFEAIGFRVSQLLDATPNRAFRIRFPWLLATIASGTICALLAGMFEATLAQSLVLAFFLTLVLGLGESVSVQSMAVTIQQLSGTPPTLSWYGGAVRRELMVAVLLGLACGILVALIVWGWRGTPVPAIVIGSSILLSIVTACLIGLTVPSILHALDLDYKIAAGPITLGLADVMTLLIYFSMAAYALSRHA